MREMRSLACSCVFSIALGNDLSWNLCEPGSDAGTHCKSCAVARQFCIRIPGKTWRLTRFIHFLHFFPLFVALIPSLDLDTGERQWIARCQQADREVYIRAASAKGQVKLDDFREIMYI
jgi:hypothetical protein